MSLLSFQPFNQSILFFDGFITEEGNSYTPEVRMEKVGMDCWGKSHLVPNSPFFLVPSCLRVSCLIHQFCSVVLQPQSNSNQKRGGHIYSVYPAYICVYPEQTKKQVGWKPVTSSPSTSPPACWWLTDLYFWYSFVYLSKYKYKRHSKAISYVTLLAGESLPDGDIVCPQWWLNAIQSSSWWCRLDCQLNIGCFYASK